ncbi:putative PHD type zinc finger protein with BAH domain-containing protein [Mortierella antarctica]|nr:putative PHD type zinc finger protein with BAH domain-containing protein [Mortierella antarctica]
MAGPGPTPGRISSAPLRDGTIISVNDHVYMASEFIGESYYIGRVMEFGKETKGKPLQVRIGWFYRPKDVMARRNYDSRLLIATMHSDMNPISSIRGLCTVTHQAYIKDLESYRKQPDHFYYNQLFDRYIHRFYDVLPVDSVRNLPLDVATELSRRYQYIVVEAGTASEYTDAHRVCLICKRWCASGEALKCIMCQGFHHMLCINPPMLKKPSKGFAFQCALCSKLAMDSSSQPAATSPPALQKHTSAINIHTSASTSGQNSPRGSPKQKAVSPLAVIPIANGGSKSSQSNAKKSTRQDPYLIPAAPLTPQDQRMSHMWPFRYFGTHADIQDIFDPDDRVYPRASSRVGTKYQAVVVKWDGPGQVLATSTIFDDPHSSTLKGRSRRGGRGGRPSSRLKVPEETESRSRAHSASLETTADGQDTPLTPSSPARSGAATDDTIHLERGGSDTVMLQYSKPSHISEEYVAAYMERVKGLTLPLPSHSADIIDRALLALQQAAYDAEKAIKDLALIQKKDFDIEDWTPKEIEAFEEGIRLYGHELFAIKKKVETRSMKDIVRFFYQWKKTERYQSVYSVFTKIHKPNKKFKSVGRGVVTSSAVEIGNRSKVGQELPKDSVLDYETIILPSTHNAGKFACAHCGTRATSLWRRLPGETDPESQFPRVYCYDCGNDWIRYVALPPLVDAQKDIKKLKGKDSSAKVLTNGSSKASPTASEVATAIKRKRSEAKTSVIKKVKEQVWINVARAQYLSITVGGMKSPLVEQFVH